MRRFRKLAPALIAAAVALAAVTGAASAHGTWHGGGTGTTTPGVLDANGDGIVAAIGQLSIHICADEGFLLAKGKVTIDPGASTGDVNWLGLHVYFGFHGCADVGIETSTLSLGGSGGGGRAGALAAGTGLTLHAEGTGIAFVKGVGTWTNTPGGSGAWSQEPTILKIGAKTDTPCTTTVDAQHYGGREHTKSACGSPTAAPTSEPTSQPEPTATPAA